MIMETDVKIEIQTKQGTYVIVRSNKVDNFFRTIGKKGKGCYYLFYKLHLIGDVYSYCIDTVMSDDNSCYLAAKKFKSLIKYIRFKYGRITSVRDLTCQPLYYAGALL